jgi:hypothetical protein
VADFYLWVPAGADLTALDAALSAAAPEVTFRVDHDENVEEMYSGYPTAVWYEDGPSPESLAATLRTALGVNIRSTHELEAKLFGATA